MLLSDGDPRYSPWELDDHESEAAGVFCDSSERWQPGGEATTRSDKNSAAEQRGWIKEGRRLVMLDKRRQKEKRKDGEGRVFKGQYHVAVVRLNRWWYFKLRELSHRDNSLHLFKVSVADFSWFQWIYLMELLWIHVGLSSSIEPQNLTTPQPTKNYLLLHLHPFPFLLIK